MPDPLVCLEAVVAAAGASAIIVLALGWPWRRASPTRLNAACILGIGVGLVLGYGVLQFRFAWPPTGGLDRLLMVVLPAAIGLELVAGIPGLPRGVAGVLRISLAAAIGRILLHGSVYLAGGAKQWGTWQAIAALVLCAALLVLVWNLLMLLNRRAPGVSIPLALSQTMLCGGLAVMLAGYVRGGMAALPPAAAVAGAAVASAAISQRFAAHGTIGVGIVALFGLLFIGRFFGGLSTGRAVVTLFSPLLCWAVELPGLRCRSPRVATALRLALVAVPLVVVLALAKRDFDREMAPLLAF